MSMLMPLLDRLATASVAGGALALLVWVCCRVSPGLSPAVRYWVWWGVALKLLLGLLPVPALGLPWLPPESIGAAWSATAVAWPKPSLPSVPTANRFPAAVAAASRAKSWLPDAGNATGQGRSVLSWLDRRWALPLVALWGLGLLLELAGVIAGLRRTRGCLAASSRADEPALQQLFAALREELGAGRAELWLSEAAATPQVVGVWRPVVLLPASMAARLGREELAMALGHELLHVRRGDLLLGLVPALAARLFFFHPLARVVAGEHFLAREEACDAAVVAHLAPSPRAYGRLLLELSTGCAAPLRASAAALTHSSLQRRLLMLLRPSGSRGGARAWSLVLVLIVAGALLPLRLTAREARAGARTAAAASAVVVPGGDAAPPSAPPPTTATVASDVVVHASSSSGHRDRSWQRRDSYIYFHGEDTTMDGSTEDIAHAERYRRPGADLLWVRRGGEEWLITAPEILTALEALLAPERELARKQADLGAQEAELGSRQAALGSQQGELGRQEAVLGEQQARLSAQIAKLDAEEVELAARTSAAADRESRAAASEGTGARRREIDRTREDLERQIKEASRRQGDLGDQQGALGSQQGALGSRQGELGNRQSALGREQGRIANEVRSRIAVLLDDAIKSGKATRAGG